MGNRTGRKPIQFSGPSTSTHIKVKNSASLKIATRQASSLPKVTLKRPSGDSLSPGQAGLKALPAKSVSLTKSSRSSENGTVCAQTLKAPLPKKLATSRVVKLKRTPLCNESSSRHSSSEPSKTPEQQFPAAAVASTSASPGQEEFGLLLESVNIKNCLPSGQLKDCA